MTTVVEVSGAERAVAVLAIAEMALKHGIEVVGDVPVARLRRGSRSPGEGRLGCWLDPGRVTDGALEGMAHAFVAVEAFDRAPAVVDAWAAVFMRAEAARDGSIRVRVVDRRVGSQGITVKVVRASKARRLRRVLECR